MDEVRVLVVSDDDVVRPSLCQAVRQAAGLCLVGAAGTATEARAAVSTSAPDVVVVDDHLDGEGWILVCRRLRSLDPQLAVLVLTSLDDDDCVLALVLAGAAGGVLRDLRRLDLAGAVRAVSQGRPLLDRETEARVRARLAETFRRGALTPVQRRVLGLVGAGLTDRQIADLLAIDEDDVAQHVAAVVRLLGRGRGAPTRPVDTAARRALRG